MDFLLIVNERITSCATRSSRWKFQRRRYGA